MSEDAWAEFCRELERAGRVILRDSTPKDELTRAEGYRHLARLVHTGFMASFELADTDQPRIVPAVSEAMLGEGETSDARYHHAFIDGSATYRVRGTRGTAPFIEFTVYAGKIGLQETSRQVGYLLEDDLKVETDGRFEVVIGPDAHPGNWIRSEPDASMLYIRQYSHDWSKVQSASFEIEREGELPAESPLRIDDIRAGLSRTASFVDRAVHFWTAIVDTRAAAPPNVFFEIPADPDPKRPTMPVGHRFAAGYFRLAEDEALEVRFRPSDVPYWGLDLTNYWFEPLSYGSHRSNVNNGTVQLEEDGSVRVVIGDSGGGASNWMDTRRHREGTMLFRWSRNELPVPKLDARVVKLSEL
ncbi:MAG: DUF1214 domain-containing protein [Deltaproteobacteria bacterium]|nr:DUF1214 domain-containing protein [Deltaproteobacteria bacterium]